MPKVSVIVPNYNHAPYLRQRIDSILNQTYQDFELILLDDCSTDNSREILESYRSDKHVSHLIFNEHNSGSTFKQWKKGIELAKGDYIWIAESDDWAEPPLLESLFSLIGDKNNVSVAFVHSVFEFAQKSEVGYIFSDTPQLYNGFEFIKKYMLCDQVIYNASAVIFRRDVVRSIDDDYQSYHVAGDKLFWIMLCEKGDVAHVPNSYNHFRKHEEEVSTKANKTGLAFEEELRIFHRNIQKRYVTLSDRKHVVDYYLNCIRDFYSPDTQIYNDLYRKWENEIINPYAYKLYIFFNKILCIINSIQCFISSKKKYYER